MVETLYTAPFDTVTAADVEMFLDLDQPEGSLLDYKEGDRGAGLGIPADSALKTIVAFANTYGGLLILGVRANKTTNRPVARDGLKLSPNRSFEEALTSQCFGSIQPPLTPEIRVCPFKSDSTFTEDDRAFVVVRVAPSAAAPHATTEHHVYVRVGSESRFADLTTLRALFERQRQREETTKQVAAEVSHHGEEIRIRFAPEWDNGQEYAQRWRHKWPRICLELVPLDALRDRLLSFVPTGVNNSLLDDRILGGLKDIGWYWRPDKPDDVVHKPNGLGVVAIYIGGYPTISHQELMTDPASTLYVDQSGSFYVNLPVASLGWPNMDHSTRPPDAVVPDPALIVPLLYRLAGLVEFQSKLLREHRYVGRVNATIWVDIGSGMPSAWLRTESHHGTAVLSALDSWEIRSQYLASMVSQMTRSWFKVPFAVRAWPSYGSLPELWTK